MAKNGPICCLKSRFLGAPIAVRYDNRYEKVNVLFKLQAAEALVDLPSIFFQLPVFVEAIIHHFFLKVEYILENLQLYNL